MTDPANFGISGSASTRDARTAWLLEQEVPFVAFGIFRYLFLVHVAGRGANPARDLFLDPQVVTCAAAWLAVTALILI